jgi:hypothetical protein
MGAAHRLNCQMRYSNCVDVGRARVCESTASPAVAGSVPIDRRGTGGLDVASASRVRQRVGLRV